MVMGAMSVGFSFVYAKRFISPFQLSPLALTTYQLGAGLLVLVFVTDFSGMQSIIQAPQALVAFGREESSIVSLC